MKNTLPRLLFIISSAVAVLIIAGQNAWPLIAVYWLVLVIKNRVEVQKVSYQFDKAAGIIMEELFAGSLRFREHRVECAKCGELLDVYCCEGGVYAVRCANCETVALVKASNPEKAALRVGIPAEDRPQGMTQAEYFGLAKGNTEDCTKGQTMRCPINGAPCNECKPGAPCAEITKEE